MNERQSYEHLIANKLQQLPVPDADQSWQEMKRLLDEDRSPRGAGGKRSGPGRGRWWGAGVIALVLITGVWVFSERTKDTPGKQSVAANTPFNNNQTTNAPAQTSTLSNSTKSTAAASNTATGDNNSNNNNSNNNSGEANSNGAPAASAAANSLPVARSNPATANSQSHPADKNARSKTNNSRYRKAIPPATGGNDVPANAVAKKAPGTKKPVKTISTGTNTVLPVTASSTAHNHHRRRPLHNSRTVPANNEPNSNSDVASSATHTKRRPGSGVSSPGRKPGTTSGGTTALVPPAAVRRDRPATVSAPETAVAINTTLATDGGIDPQVDTSDLLNDSTRARMAKAKLPEPTKAVVKKDKKPFRLNLNLSLPPLNPLSMRSDNDPWWGAGLAFNAPVPVGGQNRYKANSNGGTGLLTDFLPSPYLEFHLNQYVYLQTEINPSTPQYMPPLLVYHQTNEITGSSPATRNETSIYAQKLYYFNWPFSLHYSPFDNFFVSAGLQFSSFQSGLATIDRKNYAVGAGANDTTFSHSLVKFKDDSIAVKFSPTEWRWQLGAEYYWNRFTVGVRYNRAFKDAIHIDAAAGLPGTSARNSAVLFFLRFNIFEGRSKDPNSSSTPASLVRY